VHVNIQLKAVISCTYLQETIKFIWPLYQWYWHTTWTLEAQYY